MTINISNKEEAAIHFLFNKTMNVEHSEASFFGHLYNTFFILKRMNQSVDVCLAGLYHAVYGTEFFDFSAPIERSEIRKYIGEYAEHLAYLFSKEDRESIILQNSMNLDDSVRLDLATILYANDFEQIRGKQISVSGEYLNDVKNTVLELRGKVNGNYR